jgi:hypothetical protein
VLLLFYVGETNKKVRQLFCDAFAGGGSKKLLFIEGKLVGK